jgi:hypothetical protein
MLHNTSREFLLQSKRGNTALVLDGLYFAGWQPGEIFSYQDAYEYLSFFGASQKLIRSGLNDPLFKRQGRRSASYTLPSPEYVLNELNLLETPFKDELTGDAFASLAAYRTQLHQRFLERAPDDYSRKLLSGRLGVSRVTTLNYEAAINSAGEVRVYVEPRFSYTRITHKNIGSLPLQASPVKGCMWLEKHTAPNVIPQKAPLVRVVALEWLKAGHEVYLTKQLTNYYQIVAA